MLIETASGSDCRRRHDRLPAHVTGLAFDPTGSTVAVADVTEQMNLRHPSSCFDVASNRPSVRSRVRPAYYCSLDYDATGRWLGALGTDPAA